MSIKVCTSDAYWPVRVPPPRDIDLWHLREDQAPGPPRSPRPPRTSNVFKKFKSLCHRAVPIHDSMNRESINIPNFQVNRESTIRQNWRILLLKELIHESRIGLKSPLFSESWIDDSQKLLNRDGPTRWFELIGEFWKGKKTRTLF